MTKQDPAIATVQPQLSTPWERIEAIMKRYGYCTPSALARELELPHPENLYRIRRGDNGISKALARRICHRFPLTNEKWLLYGKGEELITTEQPRDININIRIIVENLTVE